MSGRREDLGVLVRWCLWHRGTEVGRGRQGGSSHRRTQKDPDKGRKEGKGLASASSIPEERRLDFCRSKAAAFFLGKRCAWEEMGAREFASRGQSHPWQRLVHSAGMGAGEAHDLKFVVIYKLCDVSRSVPTSFPPGRPRWVRDEVGSVFWELGSSGGIG